MPHDGSMASGDQHRSSDDGALVRVLERDPDLASELEGEARAWAVSRLVAPALRVPVGPWTSAGREHAGALGLLIIEGALLHEYVDGAHASARLLGPGDLIAPWASDEAPSGCPATWSAVQATDLVELDGRFSLVAQRCPGLFTALTGRLIEAADRDGRLTASLLRGRVEERILSLFWHVAERWGTVGPAGITLELPLTHQTIGRLIGARRPTVTLALGSLQEAGALGRLANGRWMLSHPDQTSTVDGPRAARLPAA